MFTIISKLKPYNSFSVLLCKLNLVGLVQYIIHIFLGGSSTDLEWSDFPTLHTFINSFHHIYFACKNISTICYHIYPATTLGAHHLLKNNTLYYRTQKVKHRHVWGMLIFNTCKKFQQNLMTRLVGQWQVTGIFYLIMVTLTPDSWNVNLVPKNSRTEVHCILILNTCVIKIQWETKHRNFASDTNPIC